MNIADLTVLPKQALDAIAGLFAQSSYTVSGLTLSATGAGSLSITVAAGTCWVNGTYVSYAGGTVVPGTAGTNPRYDLIRIANGAAVPSIVAGTASSTPAFPALGAGDLFIGYAFIGAGATDYTVAATAFIADYTMPFALGNGLAATPALVFKNSLTTGFFRQAANVIGIAINAVETLRITATVINALNSAKFQEGGNNIQPLTTQADLYYYSTKPDRLPKGTGLQQLRMNAGATAPEWATITSALTTANASLGADVAMTNANTFYDGPSVSLAAGTWLITATVTCHGNDAATDYYTAKLWDGTTVWASGSATNPAGTNSNISIPLSSVVVLGSTTTVKISVTNTGAGMVLNAAAQNNGAGNNATQISAVKVA